MERIPAVSKLFATFTGNLFLVLGSLLIGSLAILGSWVPPRGAWVFAMARLWSILLLRAGLVRVEVRHPSHQDNLGIDPAASYIFLANHQSLFDIPALLSTVPAQVRMMAKRSLFRIPVFGWALAAGGFIPIDRGDRSTARQSFASAIAHIRSGTSILLFPEGTRSTVDILLPFERGGFLLALKSGLPIVPVGIRGTRAIQRRGVWTIQPGTVVVTYGSPIDSAAYGVRRKRELIAEVRRRVAELAGLALPAEEDREGPVVRSEHGD